MALLLFVCAIAGTPLLVDTEAARRSIAQRVSALAGGEVRYESLAVQLLPTPRAEMRGITVQVAGAVEGRIATAGIRFALLPLFSGKLRVSHVEITQPVVKIRIPPPAIGSDTFAIYRQVVGPAVTALTRDAAGMAISINGGKVEVFSADQPFVSLSELTAAASISSDAVEASASCAADLWRKAQGQARIAAGTLAGSARLQFTGSRVAQLQSAGGGAWFVRPGEIDSSLDVETDGTSKLRIAANTTTPQLRLVHGTREKELGALRAATEFVREGGAITISLTDLQVGELLRDASGVLRTSLERTTTAFDVKVPRLDLAQLHAAAMAVAGDHGVLPAPFGIVQAGTLRDFSASGALPAVDARALQAEAQIEDATVSVPAAGIVVRGGSGRFRLAVGVLQGRELKGDIERSTFSAGTLALELKPAVRLHSLGATLSSDLADALRVARHLTAAHEPAALAGIEAIAGRATGTINYDARRSASPLAIEMTNVQATGSHRSAPFPLAVTRGTLQYSGAGVRVSGLAGSVGRSRISDASLDIDTGSEPAFRSASGDAELLLDEVVPWLKSFDMLRPALGVVETATGVAHVRLARLTGTVAKPAALEFVAAVEPRQATIRMPSLYAPLIVAAGSLEISARTLKLTKLALAAGDTRATVSGTVDDYASAAPRADIELAQGAVGQQGMDWIRARRRLPAEVMLRAPVAISSARLRWAELKRDPVLVQGKFRVGDAVDADLDLAWQSGDMDLQRLALKDADTDVNATLHWKPAAIDASFDGVLDRRTFARMLAHPPQTAGSVQGNFRALLDVREPRRSRANGKLEGEGLDLARWFGIPLVLERFSAEAKERVLQVRESSIVVAGQRMNWSGSVEGGEKTWAIDGRLNAKTLDVDRLLDDAVPNAKRATSSGRWDLPVTGRVAITAEALKWRTHALQSVAGSLELAPDRISVMATDARYCGASAPSTAVFTPGRIDAKAKFTVRGQAIERTLPCLSPDAPAMTGTYDFDADLAASGSPDELRDSAVGTFRLTARDGRIVHSDVLESTLTVEEVAKRMQADAPKVKAEGFEYKQIMLAGAVDSGRARIDQGVIDGASMYLTIRGDVRFADGGLQLEGLVAPLTGGLLGATLVVVPVGIRGTVGDPLVSVVPAAAVGMTLMNVLTARFLLPFNLFDSAGGESQGKP